MLTRRGLLRTAPTALAAPPAARAQAGFPQRQLRILVPFTPGGSPDLLARLLAEEAGRRWPAQGAVAENRPGAGGNIAAEAVARAAPDGHVLLLLTNNIAAMNPHLGRMSIDPLADLAPIALLARSQLVLVVNPTLAVQDLAGLLALARAQPGGLAYASAGNGTPQHVAMAWLGQLTGTVLAHVPYRGTAPALADLAGGRVAAMAAPSALALPMIQEGRVRPIAVAGARRLALLPEVPTVAEAGLAGYEVDTWFALVAPRGTPPAATAPLEALALESMALPRLREPLERQGIEPDAAGVVALGALMQRDHDRWGAVIRAAGIREE